MSKAYYRPILGRRADLSKSALQLAGGWRWFDQVEVLTRTSANKISAKDLPSEITTRLTQPRADLRTAGFDVPQIMGILNVTPDSFSDGGDAVGETAAVEKAKELVAAGANILDIGGESTRPGAQFVPSELEIKRTAPVAAALKGHVNVPMSIDTRKADVAEAAIKAGVAWVNDVSALTFDSDMANLVAQTQVPICLMHAQGDPKTMQAAPFYENVLLDVYDYLEDRIAVCEAHGISRENIMVDPGIGFGKTLEHNLELLKGLALFQSLGCSVLLGASRKRFIGTLTDTPEAKDRVAGSVAVALDAAVQGAQVIRVHDVAQTRQAVSMWMALNA